jgi:hypothetical protein
VVATTNTVFTLTNTPTTTATNTTGGGTNTQTYTVNIITYFTNHAIVYQPVTCPADTVALRQGIERVQFVRRDFDSLIGTFWAPATNDYTMMELTNNALRPQLIRRVVNQPDFLFTAADLTPGPAALELVQTVQRSGLPFSQVASNNLAGPGTILPGTTFTYNKVGPLYYNFNAVTLGNNFFFTSDQSSAIQGLLWASYDGSTNDPVIYPDGTSLDNLINQFFLQITSPSGPLPTVNGSAQLPDGANGTPYTTFTLSANGGQAPYTWSFSPGSPGLPGGLTLTPTDATGQSVYVTSAFTSDGNVQDTDPLPATYDFSIRVTDASSRYVDVPFTITIDP